MPLLLLAALEQLLSDGRLQLHNGTWRCAAPDELDTCLRAMNPLESRIRALPELELRLLVLCAVAGVPLPRAFVTGMIGSNPAWEHTVVALERLGHLADFPDGLAVSHDAIAECTLRVAPSELVRRVEGELGTALVASPDERLVRRGIRHLLNADEFTRAMTTVATLVRRAHATLPGAVRARVASILERSADDDEVERVLRAVPWSARVPRRRTLVGAVAGVVMAAVGVAAIVTAARPPVPDAVFEIRQRDGMGRVRSALVPLGLKDWSDPAPIRVTLGAPKGDTVPRTAFGAHVKPGEDAWLVERDGGDAEGINVEVRRPDGSREPLTASRLENTPGAWSPDGRYVAVQTTQWGDSGHSVIGMLALKDGSMRKLTPDRESQSGARWSPDGTRIAYVSRRAETTLVCLAPIVGTRHSCSTARRRGVVVDGWTDDTHILLSGEDNVDHIEQDVAAGTQRQLAMPDLGIWSTFLSPDGRWLLYVSHASDAQDRFRVAPVNDLAHPRRVSIGGVSNGPLEIDWRGTTRQREYLDSLAIEAPSDSISVDEPTQLRVAGFTNLHERATVHAVTWRSTDTAIVTIDSLGMMHPLKPGAATVDVSAGGWRAARRSFRVVASSSRDLFVEAWNNPFASRWRPFGHPFPRIVRDSVLGPSFLNNGDGTYFSGAYLRTPFDGRKGLALDAVIRINVTRPQWQYMEINIEQMPNPALLETLWNHVTGYLPAQFRPLATGCSASYPRGEGRAAALTIGGGGELPRRPGATRPDIANGVPTRVRLQIFPDGRCGVAVDGAALGVSVARLSALDSLFVVLQGSSLETRALVGALRLRTGVPADIDWSLAQRR